MKSGVLDQNCTPVSELLQPFSASQAGGQRGTDLLRASSGSGSSPSSPSASTGAGWGQGLSEKRHQWDSAKGPPKCETLSAMSCGEPGLYMALPPSFDGRSGGGG